jgi:hypothetical protein
MKDSVYEITTDVGSLYIIYTQDYTVLSRVVFVKFLQREGDVEC